MATNTTTRTTTEFLLTAARAAYGTLRRGKGKRPQAVLAFLNAESDVERDEVIEELGAGFVRRGLREAAKFYTTRGDEEVAMVFLLLRDDVDDDGFYVDDSAASEATD